MRCARLGDYEGKGRRLTDKREGVILSGGEGERGRSVGLCGVWRGVKENIGTRNGWLSLYDSDRVCGLKMVSNTEYNIFQRV